MTGKGGRGMETDYNPQIGCRRTLFDESYDFLEKLHSWELKDGVLYLVADTYRGRKAALKVTFLTATSFRLQMFPENDRPEPRNPIIRPDMQAKAVLTERDSYFEYGTEQVQLRFCREFWELSVYSVGRLLTKEQIFDTNVDNRWKCLPIGFCCDEDGRWTRTWETMYLFSDETFWGFGEKFTDFNKRGQYLHCWQKDALSTNSEDSYKSHPFFISSRGYAVLLNTYTRSEFDMGNTSQVSYRMSEEDGYLDYIFLADPSRDYKKLLDQYISLMGRIPVIPKWAFGFWMSKCSYQTRQEIETVVLRAEKEEIPIDVIHIDNWQKPDGIGTWEWDRERFPNPEGMIQWLKSHHVHLSLWIYPYLTEDSKAFPELEAKGYFVKNRQGGTALFYAMADAPHRAACFDFTNPEFLAWYEKRVSAVLQMGVSVVKTDFSEAVPEDAVYYDGTTGIEGHNRITSLYAETIYALMKKYKEKSGQLPMIWGRSGYAGAHRTPGAWAGDSSSALNNHSAILKGGLSLAMSGVAFWGYDLGGFYNTAFNGNECMPSEEEYLRSVEMGLFLPLSRAHGKTPREPWNFSPYVLEVVRRFIRLRRRMLPYLYSAACQSHLKNVPMLRPLLLEYPKDPVAVMQELSYLLGDSLLILPPFDRETYAAYLPQGKWLNLTTREIVEGGRYLTLCPLPDELPVFQRENSILPMMREGGKSRIPTGKFEHMNVQLFFTSRMETEFYDVEEDGSVRSYYFRAFLRKEDGCLCIETDMEIQDVDPVTEHSFTGIELNGCYRPSENR